MVFQFLRKCYKVHVGHLSDLASLARQARAVRLVSLRHVKCFSLNSIIQLFFQNAVRTITAEATASVVDVIIERAPIRT